MNYNESLDYIHSLSRFGSKPGLDRIKILAARLGNPQHRLKFIHIAGTNGKGSTAAFLASILSCEGYSTGLYTSPFLVCFNERIMLNGKKISNEDLAEYATRVKAVIDVMVGEGLEHPTEFEVITALSFLYFLENKCDVVVLETGMGGRFDATNSIPSPVVSVITKIAMDHMGILGNTLSCIAYEKAGIIKKNGKVVTYPQEESAYQTIAAVCKENDASLYIADINELTGIEVHKGGLGFYHPLYGKIKTSVNGIHQVYNAAVAIKTIEVLKESGFNIKGQAVLNGFSSAKWPGRFELLRENPDFYIDAAHNPDGIRSFIDTFREVYPGKKATVIFGVMKDKDYETMLREISVITNRFIAVTPETPRALSAKSLYEIMRKYCENVECSDTIIEAVEKTIYRANKNDVIVALGSLFYIGHVRNILKNGKN